MGDRRMAQIKTSKGSLYVYTHWQGYKLPEMAREAVKAAAPRLGDEPYWTRIVVDQLTKDGRDCETGFGLSLKPECEDSYNHDQPSVIIDAKDGSVREIGPHKEVRAK
jgi:hypothetical protein